MNKEFKFDAGDANGGTLGTGLASQSPWEFSGYSQSVAEEHLQRRTTSIDDKISRARHKKEQREKLKRAQRYQSNRNEESEDDDQYSSQEDDTREDNEAASEALNNEEDGEASIDEDITVSGNKAKATGSNQGIRVKGKAGTFFSSDVRATFHAKSFMELNLSRPLLRACEALGYKRPTPIQAACIPLALTGRDICGSAVTGSGKTAAFALPLLERLLYRPRRIPAIRVLILTPTRELAVQVHSMIEKLAQFTDIRCCLVVGGLSTKVQEVGLRADPDIVIATPGRMIDHLHNTHSVGLEDLAILVLDEADRLLELGFSSEVHELVRLCPKKRQTMLFSATMTEEVNELIELSLINPVRLSADPSTQRPATLLEQVVKIRPQHEGDREAVLLALCTRSFTSKVIIFSGTKVEAHRLKILFGLSGLKAAELHGNLTQAQRLDALESFRKMDVDFLIATDVAARGLDIVGVETVINFECPRDITTYVHRVGRTARAGQKGCAVTFISENDRPLLKAVTKKAGSKLSNRVVSVDVIMKWHNKIIEMESSVQAVITEEREERALRKAEMEANKAQNLIEYESEIYSRPRKTWFQTPKEKRQTADAAKAARISGKNVKPSSLENAENAKKRSREHEKNMTRKKRRRLEAAQTTIMEETSEAGYENEIGNKQARKNGSVSKKQNGATVAELAYRRAKSAKALDKARESGKLWKSPGVNRKKPKVNREKNKKAEMEELFQGDMMKTRTKAQGSAKNVKSGRKPGVSKRSFKSKARYKRR